MAETKPSGANVADETANGAVQGFHGVRYQVTDVARSFAFNEQTGYLVPSWQFTGTFAGTEWLPNMDARQR